MDSMVLWTAMGAIATVLAAAVALLMFWLNFDRRVSEAKEAAKIATDKADVAIRNATDIHNRITAEQASMALYRETIAREYVRRDVLREMEERIMGAMRDGLGGVKDSIGELRSQINKVLSERPHRAG